MANLLSSTRRIAVCAAVIAAVAFSFVGRSAVFAKGKKNNNNNRPRQQPPTSQPMNPQLTAASQRLQAAQQALNEATDAFKKKYEATDQWVAAAAAQKDAQKNLNHEHEAVLDKLAGTDEYKAAIAKKEQASADLQAANDDPTNSDPQHIADLATAVSQATQSKSTLENQAVANDPDYAAAHSKLQAADKAMGDLQAQEKLAMQQDPDWSKAHQNLVDAQSAYDKLIG